MSATVLVTGGAGYIGSHVCKSLVRQGYKVVNLDNLSTGYRALARWGTLEIGDLRDAAFLDAVMARHKPQAVVHLAALSLVAESFAKPELYHDNNVTGFTRLLNAMQAHQVRQFVFSSSCAVYGIPAEDGPIALTCPLQPISPYGETKRAIEGLLEDAAKASPLRYVSLRYFNAAGADPDGETGECHTPETHVIPLALRAALARQPFFLNGNDYPTPDGTAVRDFVHVCDIAEAHVQALGYLQEGKDSAVFNLGSGTGTSVQQLVTMIGQITGSPLQVTLQPRRAGDPPFLVADTTLTRRFLHWEPRYSLEEALLTALAWERAQQASAQHTA